MPIRGLNQSTYGGDGGLNIKRYIGKHIVRLTKVENTVSQRNQAPQWIPQLEVVKSANERLQSMVDNCGGKVLVGDVMQQSNWPTFFFDEIKRFLGAVLDKDPADAGIDWEAEAEKAENGDYEGTLLGCVVTETGKYFTQGKLTGEPITQCRYEHLGQKD